MLACNCSLTPAKNRASTKGCALFQRYSASRPDTGPHHQGHALRVPQISSNQLRMRHGDPLSGAVPDGAYAYFAHSYYCDATDDSAVLAVTDYGLDYPVSCGIATRGDSATSGEKPHGWATHFGQLHADGGRRRTGVIGDHRSTRNFTMADLAIEILGSGGAVRTPRPGCTCECCTMARRVGPPWARMGPSIFVHGPDVLIDTPEDICFQVDRAQLPPIRQVYTVTGIQTIRPGSASGRHAMRIS